MDPDELKNEEQPIVDSSLDDGANEDIINNNNDVNEGSDMGDTSEEATPILGGKKKSEPVVAPAPSAEPTVEAQPQVVEAAPKKKSHAGLIATIIILIVLLIGGGVAAFLWMMWHESPEVAINDAMAKAFEAENRTISGTANVSGSKISFEGVQADGSLGGSGKISIMGLVDVKFNAAMIKDGDLYIKLDGIQSALKNIPLGDILGGMMGGSSSSANGLDASELISNIVSSIGEIIDGEWIKISSSDIKEYTSNMTSGCGYDEISNLLNGTSKKEIAEAYKKNAFIVQKKDTEVEDKDGVKYYEVEINEEKSKAFAEAIKETEFGKTYTKCNVKETSEDKSEDGKTEYVAGSIKNSKIYLGVKPWSHELAGLKIVGTDDNNKLSADFKIGYEKKSVEEPSSAKTIDDIKGKIESAVKKGYVNYMKSYAKKICQSTYGSYGSVYVDACVKQIVGSLESQIESYSLEDIAGGLGGLNL